MTYLGSIFGCLLSGFSMVWYGQRKSLLLALPIAFLGWLLLGIGSSIWMIQLARLLLGIYVGFGYTCAGNYVTEIAHRTIRGQLSSLVNVSRQLGYVFIYGVGSLSITWRQLAFLSGGITVIGPFLGLLSLPDSPRWLASVERFDEAKKSLKDLRGHLYDVDSELTLISAQILLKKKSGTVIEQVKELGNPLIIGRFLFLNVLFVLYTLSGNCPVVTYTAFIFKKANNYLNKYESTILIGAVRTLGSCAFLFVGDRFSRRIFTEIAILFMFISTFMTGLYFFLKESYDVSNLRWIPLLSLSIHQFFSLFNPIHFFPSELLPTSVRSIGSSVIWAMSFIVAFLIVFFFPIMGENMGMYGTFWFYTIGSLIFYVVTVIFLPESRGISLEVINHETGDIKEESEQGA